MLFIILVMISVLMSFSLCSSKTGFVKSDTFDRFQEYEEPVYSYSTYPGGDNPRVNPNILKCPFHSLVGEGVSASGGRLQSDSVQYTHLLPHSYSLAFARGCVILQLTHSLSSFAYFSFISSYFTLIILSEVL